MSAREAEGIGAGAEALVSARPRFAVRPISFQSIHELPGAWSDDDYRRILMALEIDDAASIPDAELKEMCFMALSDLEIEDAAQVVLQVRFGDALRPGQIEDIAHGYRDERMWEAYGNIELHEELFNVGQLLFDAFNGTIDRPEAVRLEMDVQAQSEQGEKLLKRPTEAFAVRLIAGGLGERSALQRLFADPIAGTSFPEATSIIWTLESEALNQRTARLRILGSGYWLEDTSDIGEYEAVAYPDSAAP
jgi:hypothetical protein